MKITAESLRRDYPAIYLQVFRAGVESERAARKVEALNQQQQEQELLLGAARAVNVQRERRGLDRLG